jgi:hypothetical protein
MAEMARSPLRRPLKTEARDWSSARHLLAAVQEAHDRGLPEAAAAFS